MSEESAWGKYDDLHDRLLTLAEGLEAEAQSAGYQVSPAGAATARYAAARIRAELAR